MSAKKRTRRALRHVWTRAEMKLLRTRYPHVLTATLAARLGLEIHQVYSKAAAMGLHKTAAFHRGPFAWRLDGIIGTSTRFKPGLTPWNKGKHFIAGGRSAETRFKKGSRPHSWRPIGSERMCSGYLQRKMTDTGYPPRDWRPVHVLVWEKHRGAVPKGCVVVFKDGNTEHIDIKNLELLTRRDLMARNSIHRYPPALRRVIRLAGKLNLTIKRTSHEKSY